MPLTHFFASLQPGAAAGWFGGSVAVALGAFTGSFVFLRRTRLMEDMPTSRVRSAAQGYVEFEGVALLMPGEPIICPLTSTRCAWWKYRVEEKQGSGRDAKWVTVDSGTSDDSFLLDDGTGQCVIDPAGAKVIPTVTHRWYGSSAHPDVPWSLGNGILRALFGKFRYTEELIHTANRIYAIGAFRTQAGGPDAFDEQADLRALLDKWKHDKKMMALFDVNKDGTVDMKEWEAARRMALQKIRAEHVELAVATPDLHILGKPKDGRPFILSGIPQATLVRRYRSFAAGCFALVLLASTFAWSAVTAKGWI